MSTRRVPLAAAGAALLAGLALCLWAPAAGAHQRSVSYSTWRLDAEGARVHARVSQLDLSRLGLAFRSGDGGWDPVSRLLVESLELRAGEARCLPGEPPTRRSAPEGWVVYAWRLECPEAGAAAQRSLQTSLLLQAAPSHLHFAGVTTLQGERRERVLSLAEPRWRLPGPAAAGVAAPDGGTSVQGYARLGVEHILTGWDHLAFVLALLLLAGTLGEVAALVTAFTVAHSVTLGLATLGVVRPSPEPVEALIGFSIALVAAENGWILGGRGRQVPLVVAGVLALLCLHPGGAVSRLALLGLALFSLCHFGLLAISDRPARLRAAVAFAFGLVHGFGFAGVLAEMQLPTARLVPALFGFNIGVELGQLAVVVLVWPALRALARFGDGLAARRVTELASAGICGLGLYWFLSRTFS